MRTTFSRMLWGTAAALVIAGSSPGIAQDNRGLVEAGERLYVAHCARCHGIGGTGGQGPTLHRVRLRHAPDDEALAGVISEGLPERGMPGAWQLSEREIGRVIAYVRSLGRVSEASVDGDPARGAEVYNGPGGCFACHTINGDGTSFGPDLTEIGLQRGAEHLMTALTEPAADFPRYPALGARFGHDDKRYVPVRAVTRSGQAYQGMRLNHDTFSIQIQTLDRRFVTLKLDDLAELELSLDMSLMPSYADTLSESELQDLVAYLASLRGDERGGQ